MYVIEMDSDEVSMTYAIFGGRFQPFHLGQLSVVEHILREESELVIGIINPDPREPETPEFYRFAHIDNPFNYWERYLMIWKTLQSKSLTKGVMVVPLPRPSVYLKKAAQFLPPDRIWYVPTIDEFDNWKIRRYEDQGEEVKEIAVDPKMAIFNATFIRKQMNEDGDWKSSVHREVAEVIQQINGVARVKKLFKRYGPLKSVTMTKPAPTVEKQKRIWDAVKKGSGSN